LEHKEGYLEVVYSVPLSSLLFQQPDKYISYTISSAI